MPELPEVETVLRGLDPVMSGAVVRQAEVRRPDLRWPFPDRMADRLIGRKVMGLRRRAKYLLVDLDGGETLLVHLGMSGRMLVTGEGAGKGADTLGVFVRPHAAADRHDHVLLHLDNGFRVTFNDPRRFGAMDLLPTAQETTHKLLAALGPEPLGNGFSGSYLVEALAGRGMSIKAALLDQKIVAGLGNIYVCEALHRAGISPKRKAGQIARRRLETLSTAIRATLAEAIEAGGSSLRDFRQADGELGYFQHSFRVYDRADEKCCREGCTGTVARFVQSGRSSFYCAQCQR